MRAKVFQKVGRDRPWTAANMFRHHKDKGERMNSYKKFRLYTDYDDISVSLSSRRET